MRDAADPAAAREVMEWLAGDDTGLSSRALAWEYLGVPHREPFGPHAPADPGDLGRCLRLILRVPAVRDAVTSLGRRHDNWARAAAAWDALAALMESEVGVGGEKARYAPQTYRAMKDAGL